MSETSDRSPAESIFDAEPSEAESAASDLAATTSAELETALADAAKNRDAYLRTLADFENYRRRALRDREDERTRAVGGLVEDLLPVLDGLALAAGSAGGVHDAKKIAEGVSMIAVQFAETLARHGVERVDPAAGVEFDPNAHEAVAHEPSADVPEGHVVQLVRPGYRVGRRLVRPAAVVVSSGKPEAGS